MGASRKYQYTMPRRVFGNSQERGVSATKNFKESINQNWNSRGIGARGVQTKTLSLGGYRDNNAVKPFENL